MENYMMINGKRIELTEEQVKLILADETKKSPFDRLNCGEDYYYVGFGLQCNRTEEVNSAFDDSRFECGNYCTDENIMKQHALHMLLNNLLWRYSMTHGGDKLDWNDRCKFKYHIAYDVSENEIYIDWNSFYKTCGAVHFADHTTAKAAIEEIVKPFIEAHPEFDMTKM